MNISSVWYVRVNGRLAIVDVLEPDHYGEFVAVGNVQIAGHLRHSVLDRLHTVCTGRCNKTGIIKIRK